MKLNKKKEIEIKWKYYEMKDKWFEVLFVLFLILRQICGKHTTDSAVPGLYIKLINC